MHTLPFETLLRAASGDASTRRYLLEDYAISYAPSVTALAGLGARARSASTPRDGLLLYANPDPTAIRSGAEQSGSDRTIRPFYDDESVSVASIPLADDEARAIARYAAEGGVRTGAEASEHDVKSEPLDRFRIVHFATHGLISESVPLRSALVLASADGDGEDGLLQAREIYHLSLASDLVVLSACRTARGRIVAGEGVQGLVHAFLYAGAQAVVASLWDVNDAQTAAFMEAFYSHLAGGQEKADALRAAKLDMIERGASAPRYWAPFVVIGAANGSIPIGEGGASRRMGARMLTVGALTAGVLAIVLVRIRRRR
jgi:CHAT domain-containing protein